MKKALLILFAAALFAGCGKGNVKPATTNLLLGRWYAVSDTTTSFVNNVEASQATFSYHTDANFAQFNSDGTGIIYVSETSPAYSENFTYKQGSNNQITFNYPAQVVNGAQQAASTKTGTIKTLTESNLVITYTSSQTINGNTQTINEIQYFSIN